MSSDLARDARHALRCWGNEQLKAKQRMAKAVQAMFDAQRDLDRAIAGKKACREKLAELDKS